MSWYRCCQISLRFVRRCPFPGSLLAVRAASSSSDTFPTQRRRPSSQHRWQVDSAPLDDKSSSASSDRHPFLLAPAASEEPKFGHVLDCLSRHRPLPEWATTGGGLGGGGAVYKSILYTAPYLAELYGYAEEFTAVVDEWFYRVRPLIMNDTRRGELTVTQHFSPITNKAQLWKKGVEPLFSPAYHLEYLGRINQATGGRLAEKLGWANISFLARRMVECGFFTYTFDQVTNSALKGLADLYKAGPSTSDERSLYVGGLRTWLVALAHYLSAAESKHTDWRLLVNTYGDNKSSIPAILSRLNVLDQHAFGQNWEGSETAVILAYLKKMLCSYAKTHFDNVTDESKSDLEKNRVSVDLNTPRTIRFLNEYASLWLRFQPELGDEKTWRQEDPDDYARGSWRSWCDASNVALAQLILTEEAMGGNEPGRTKDTALSGSKCLAMNYKYLSAQATLYLLYNAVQAACAFDHTASFYEILYQSWRTTLHQYLKGVELSSCWREISLMVPLLIRLAVRDATRPIDSHRSDKGAGDSEDNDETSGGHTGEDQREAVTMAQHTGTTWNKYHDDSVRLALSLFDKLRARNTEISYRAAAEMMTALADLRDLAAAERTFSLVPLDEIIDYLRDWCAAKRRKNLAYNAAPTATEIRTALQRLRLPDSENVNSALSELDKLYSIGTK